MNSYAKRFLADVSRRCFSGAGWLAIAFLTGFLAAGAAPCSGQTFTANLSGVVTDPQGALVPNVEIQIKNTATSEVRRTTSAADGSYVFSNLLPGDYELTAKAQGFKTFVERNITLLASRSAELNVSLELGELAQSVEVTAAAVLLDTRSANDTATLTRALVTELPTNTRSPLNFVFALAGTTEGPAGMTSSSSTTDQNFSTFGLQGGRSGGSQILLDGAPATAADWGGLMVSPTVDAVQEMQVVRNTYDAQYGKGGGGIVTLVSKGGASKFHGTGYEFLRAENLDATTWNGNRWADPTCTTPECNKQRKGEFKRHQFGGNISGPIWEKKSLFFFAAYEGLREAYPGTTTTTVPTALQRQGDFSETFNPFNEDGECATDPDDPACRLAVIYNPFTTREDPNNRGTFLRDPFDPSCEGLPPLTPCPGNVLDPSLIDPVGANVLALYPLPNRPGEGPAQLLNFFAAGHGRTINDKVEARVDWAHNEKHRMFGRWTHRLRQNGTPPCYFCNGADGDFGMSNSGFHVSLDNTFTPTPTWVIDVLLGAGYSLEEQISPSLGVLRPSSIGLNDADYDAAILPYFGIGGYQELGNPSEQKIRKFPRYVDTLQINATKEWKSHTFKFGWMGESSQVNNIDRFAGYFYFGRGMTSGPVAATDTSETGNSIASLLLGTGSGNSTFNADIAMSARYYGWYFQDTWRLNPKLTLIVGLRYEIQPGATERYNRLAYFNPDAVNPLGDEVGLPLRGGFEYASSGNRRAWPTDKSDLAPRLGLAYKLTDKLVMRAGFGVFYAPATAMITFDQPGQHIGFSTITDMVGTVGGGGFIPSDLLSNPFPDGLNQPTGSADGLMTAVGGGISQLWPSGPHPTGYKQHFSLDFQYEIGRGSVFEIGYTGFRARKLMFGEPALNANQLDSKYLSMGTALDELVPNPMAGQVPGFLGDPEIPRQRLLRPFPHFDYINWTRSLPGATANYDALNLKFTHQFRSGLSLLSTYQWSKVLDTGSEDFLGFAVGGQYRDYYNRKLEYSVSGHDMPHSFVTAMVYELPFGRGKKFGANWPGAANQTLGGWQLSSVLRFSSGLPVLPVFTYGNLGSYGYGWNPPNITGSPKIDNPTPERWFNTDVFSQPADYTYGNAPRYNSAIREEGAKNVDFALMKNFKTEAFKIQFRAEFLNAFNTTQFGGGSQWWSNIQNDMNGGMFGKVDGVRNMPRNIQLGLKVEF